MKKRTLACCPLVFALLSLTTTTLAQNASQPAAAPANPCVEDNKTWFMPAEPMKIIGNIYSVGTNG